jgi:hypothetical protein
MITRMLVAIGLIVLPAACMLRPSQASDARVEEVLIPSYARGDVPVVMPLSLTDAGPDVLVIRAYGPAGSSVGGYVMFIGRDTHSFIAIDRKNADNSFMFSNELHGECLHGQIKFYRKIIAGKAVGFYAVQSAVQNGKTAESYDDYNGATVVRELFRLSHTGGQAMTEDEFRSVAKLNSSGATCGDDKLTKDIEELILKN